MERFFLDYFINILVNHFSDFKGKSDRKQFWLFLLIVLILSIIVSVAAFFIESFAGGSMGSLIVWLFGLSMLLPVLSIAARRIRDTKRSPYFLIAPFACFLLAYTSLYVGYFVELKELFYKLFLAMSGLSVLSAVYVIILFFLPSKN